VTRIRELVGFDHLLQEPAHREGLRPHVQRTGPQPRGLDETDHQPPDRGQLVRRRAEVVAGPVRLSFQDLLGDRDRVDEKLEHTAHLMREGGHPVHLTRLAIGRRRDLLEHHERARAARHRGNREGRDGEVRPASSRQVYLHAGALDLLASEGKGEGVFVLTGGATVQAQGAHARFEFVAWVLAPLECEDL
jgi:hypothetical protein